MNRLLAIAMLLPLVLTCTAETEQETPRPDWPSDNGKELWRVPIGATYPQEHPDATDAPLSTPAIHAGTVFALSSGGELAAVQLSDGRSTCSLDPANGKIRWCAGSDPVGYQSPLKLGDHIAVTTSARIQALDPDSGEELWSVEHIAPLTDGYTQLVPLSEGQFLAHYLGYTAGYRLTGALVEESWRTQEMMRNLAAPVVNAGRIYGFLREQLVCLDANTGEQLWLDEEIEGRGLALVGNHLVVWSADGTLRLARLSGETIEVVAQVETGLTDGYTAPSFSDGHFFVRSLEGIAAVRLDVRAGS